MTMRRAGYAPLESAGEYVCECLRDGDRVFPRWHGEVGERIVRCRDCACATVGTTFDGGHALVCRRFQSFNHGTDPNGFCAWGERRESK